MNVLVACEESQRVCNAFRERGHMAYSCDILEPSGGHPECHILGDVLPILKGGTFRTMDGQEHYHRWDLLIAHPPCTYLTVTANRWYNVEKYGDDARARYEERYKAIVFFMQLACADVPHICIENPVGIMSSCYRKPDQIIGPEMFGDPFEKKTCLWLKGLPKLEPTDIVDVPPRQMLKSGKSMPAWYSNASGDRARARSKTFPGIAKAMADQWGWIDD